MAIRRGDIFHIEAFPPLDGDAEKGRYVIVMADHEEGDDGVEVVGITKNPRYNPDREALPLPNRRTHRPCTTNLWEDSWAIPSWYVLVAVERFGVRRHGYVEKQTMAPLLRALNRARSGGLNALELGRRVTGQEEIEPPETGG